MVTDDRPNGKNIKTKMTAGGSRRNLLKTMVAASSIGLAGCTGENNSGSGGNNNQSSDGGSGNNSRSNSNNSQPNSGNQITIKFSDIYPEDHPVYKNAPVYWMDRVMELTNNKVQFDVYPAGQLAEGGESIGVISGGTADMGFVGPSYNSDRMPLSSVVALPGSFSSTVNGSKAFWQLAQGILSDEVYSSLGLKPLFVTVLPPYQIMTTGDKISRLNDWSGKSIRTGGGTQSLTVRVLGGSPTEMPGAEMYSATERGTLNGAILPLTSVKAYDYQELIENSSTNVNLGSFAVTYMINVDVWSNLPSSVQEAMQTAGEETVTHAGNQLDGMVSDLTTEFRQNDIDMYKVPSKDLTSWNNKLKQVEQNWVSEVGSGGTPAEKTLNAWKSALSEIQGSSGTSSQTQTNKTSS